MSNCKNQNFTSKGEKETRYGHYQILAGQKDEHGSTHKNYKRKSDIRQEIRYISRKSTNTNPTDLLCYGAINANARSVSAMIKDFESTHALSRQCKDYRYLYHEVYYFSDKLTPYMEANKVNYPKLAKQLGKKVATSGDHNHHYQVAYAIHEKNDAEKTHIHFIVNSVDACTFQKRRFLRKDKDELETLLNSTVSDYIKNDLQ